MTNRDRSTILVVEHDDTTRAFLGDHLVADGYEGDRRGLRCAKACAGWSTAYPDLAIIDVRARGPLGPRPADRHVRESDGVACRGSIRSFR